MRRSDDLNLLRYKSRNFDFLIENTKIAGRFKETVFVSDSVAPSKLPVEVEDNGTTDGVASS